MQTIANAVKEVKNSAEALADKVEDEVDIMRIVTGDLRRQQTMLDGSERDIWQPEDSECHDRMEWRIFEGAIRIIIVMNVACLGLREVYPENEPVWYVFENVFTALFTIEMFIKLKVLEKMYFCDSWNLFDFFVCWVCIIDTWMLPLAGTNESFNQLSAARFFRLLRILRAVRILEVNQQLIGLVASLSSSLKALVWIMVLMLMVIYISALFMMGSVEKQFYGIEEFDVDLFFGGLGQSMLTMFNICIAAQWVEVAQPLFLKQQHIFCFLVIYVFVTTFAILNLVIGVIAERTMAAQVAFDEEQEEKRKKTLMRNIVVMADAIFDDDHDGGLEMKEMEDHMNTRPDLKELLMTCGLPRGFSINDLHLIFDEKYGGTVDKEEFITGMFRLIFNNEFQRDCCTLLTVAQVKSEVKSVVKELKDELEMHMDRLFNKTDRTGRDKPGEDATRKDSSNLSSSDRAATDDLGPQATQGKETTEDSANYCQQDIIEDQQPAAHTTIEDVGVQLGHVSAAIKVMSDAQRDTRRLMQAQLDVIKLAARDGGSANADLVNPMRAWPRTREASETLTHSFDSTGGDPLLAFSSYPTLSPGPRSSLRALPRPREHNELNLTI